MEMRSSMSSSNISSSSKSNVGGGSASASTSHDLIDAKLEEHQLCVSRHCPGCGHKLVKPDWLGLPAGVKFDPTDQELIEHLEAKVEESNNNNKDDMKSHPLIDEFIPTIEGDDGICYTHPEKLPGVTRDGLSRHFFHRPSKAYTTGTRKRRKIQNEQSDFQGTGETRWHKTGKTRPVMVNGSQKGCKKILVLYTNFGKNRKPEKTNWVMHQYHLGQHEEEKEGELVVSKIFYQTQPRQCNWVDRTGSSSAGIPITITTPAAAAAVAVVDHHLISSSIRGDGTTTPVTSSREMIAHQQQRESEFHGVASAAAVMSSYGGGDHHHHFGFPHQFTKSFDNEASTAAREVERGQASAAAGTCDETSAAAAAHYHQIAHDHHQHHQQQQHAVLAHHDQSMAAAAATSSAAAAFHLISRPSPPISTIISPPDAPLHHASIILDHHHHQHDPYHVSRLFLQNQLHHHHHQQQQEEEQHHKVGGEGRRSASGLEEVIMGCTTSSSSHDIKEESSMANNPQEAEWMKFPSFWPDPDNHDHHNNG